MILSATGHRPNKLGGYSDEAAWKLFDLATAALIDLKPDKVISGMALGWDQAVAWAAYEAGIPFIAAVPFEGQEKAWPPESQKDFKELLAKSGEVVYVSEGGYAPWKMQVRNQWMVDHSDHVLAMWDGSDGGTANCFRYALAKNKKITNLWEQFNG